jgi:hypothetical protein
MEAGAVKIFFSMRHLGMFRMYEPTIRELAARGHRIHLALGRGEALGWGTALDNLLADSSAITWSWLTPSTSAFWFELAKTIRLWADYLRYFQPQYDVAPKLKARAEERVPPRLVRFSQRPAFRNPANRRRLLTFLRTLEGALPPVPEIEQQLREEQPDLVLITPLVYLGSSQFEVLRTANALGLRTGFCVGSWDHLSSKALIRDMPQRVIVWNETQKREAVELHGVPADRVVVTGAQCYDQWFGRRPVRTREEFCRRVGLSPDRPFILYVCSALFWGSPVEADFVPQWVRRLRESAHPEVRSTAVLIRPHPARMPEWQGIDLSPFPDVAFYGSNPVDDASKDDYFESLFYCSAVVGLNTSAFLEGAVVGRPVHTILLPEFQENQEGVLHFHYLLSVGGGVLRAGRSFDEHHTQLAASLRSSDEPGTNSSFVREFIRPHGLDRQATPLFCDAVEDLLRVPAPEPERTPLRSLLLRAAMFPVFHVLRRIYGSELIRDDWSRKERAQQERREARLQARAERRRLADAQKRERDQRRAGKQAAREAAVREAEAARNRNEEAKGQRKRIRERDKEARARRRARATLRGRIKQHAARWLKRGRPGGQTT